MTDEPIITSTAELTAAERMQIDEQRAEIASRKASLSLLGEWRRKRWVLRDDEHESGRIHYYGQDGEPTDVPGNAARYSDEATAWDAAELVVNTKPMLDRGFAFKPFDRLAPRVYTRGT